VPEEQNVVDPVAQLQQRLDAFRKESKTLASLNSGQPGPLEILYALSRSTPTTGALELQEILRAADSVRITGSCDSYATFSQWQQLLKGIPGLRVDDVPRTTKDPRSGRVQFLISLSMRENKA
jgi:Tfp pilus assembly protein PilN